LVGGLAQALPDEDAAKISFLLATPVIFAACVSTALSLDSLGERRTTLEW
jgi:undecaprenyl pyrophosphate phosphatase UppP